MFQLKNRIWIVGYIVVICAGSTTSAAWAEDEVPLTGSFEGVGAAFSGTFTHLGLFQGVFDPVQLTAVWTAADGDTVTNQTISFVPTEEVAPGVFHYEQELVITGGTGRFANATGTASVTGTINFLTGTFDGQLVGTISQPNSGS